MPHFEIHASPDDASPRPAQPWVEIVLGDAVLHRQANGKWILSEMLGSNKEIDDAVDRMAADLEAARKDAKAELAMARRKMLRYAR